MWLFWRMLQQSHRTYLLMKLALICHVQIIGQCGSGKSHCVVKSIGMRLFTVVPFFASTVLITFFDLLIPCVTYSFLMIKQCARRQDIYCCIGTGGSVVVLLPPIREVLCSNPGCIWKDIWHKTRTKLRIEIALLWGTPEQWATEMEVLAYQCCIGHLRRYSYWCFVRENIHC